MKSFKEYQTLSATGLWRAGPEDQRREVTVSIGEATLTMTDDQNRVLAHWSLPALVRANPGQHPAIFHPDGDPGETLELAAGEAEMIRALDRLRTVIERHRPHPGRLRLVILVAVVAAILAGGIFWLPDALRRHAVAVVPLAKRAAIGEERCEARHLVHRQRHVGRDEGARVVNGGDRGARVSDETRERVDRSIDRTGGAARLARDLDAGEGAEHDGDRHGHPEAQVAAERRALLACGCLAVARTPAAVRTAAADPQDGAHDEGEHDA